MKNTLVFSLLFFIINLSAIAAGPTQTLGLICLSETPFIEVMVYGELGSIYEDDSESNTAITFSNHISINAKDLSLELPNSLSISNDFNDYTLQSFVYDPSSRNLKRALTLVFESESGNVGHITVKLPELELETTVTCQFRQ